MKRLFAFLLALAMVLSLAACGGEPDPNAGVYQGIRGEMDGIVLTMEELYPGESYLELKNGGKAVLVLEGDSFNGKWTLDGENFNLVLDGENCPGTLKDGIVILDFCNMGMFLTFAMDGVKVPPSIYSEVGTYHLYALDENGEYVDYETLVSVGMENVSYVIFNEDGTGIIGMEGDEISFTYDDGAMTDEEGFEYYYLLTDGIMEIYLGDGMTFYYQKGDIVRFSETGNAENETSDDESSEVTVPDGPLGLYQGTTYEYNGQTFQMTEIYNDICTIELLDGGKCTFILGGEVMDATWTLDGETFVLTNAMVESPGTLADGVITIDFMEMGMMLTFEKAEEVGSDMVSDTGTSDDGVTETFPDVFIADHEGDWHGMAIVYEGTGDYADEEDMEFEIIGRLVFHEDGTCEPYLACALGGDDINFKNLTASYSVDGDVMLLNGEFLNLELINNSNLFALDGALYVDIYVDDGDGNTMNLYACLRRLDAAWDYDNDWLALSEDAVEFYKDKDFLEIAELFQLDLDEIPELDGQSGSAEAPATEPAASGAGILDYETIAEVYDWVLDYSSAANGYGKISYEEIVERMGGVEGAETCLDLWNDTTRFYKWGVSEDEYIQLTFSLKDGVWVKSGATNTSMFMDIYKKYYR